MTLGMLFWPQGMPVLVSDTVISTEPIAGNPTAVIPRNADFDASEKPVLPMMVRKSMTLDPGVIFTFAGNQSKILSYAKEARKEWARVTSAKRTIDHAFSTFTSQSFTNYGIQGIMVAGSYDKAKNTVRFANTSNAVHSTGTPNCGQYIAIGSGAEFAIRYFERTSKQQVNPHIYAKYSPQQKLRLDTVQTSGSINNGQLFLNESYGYRDDWGGYLETFVFDADSSVWRPYASTVHLRCFIEGTADKPIFRFSDKIFFYSAEQHLSRLFLHTMRNHHGGFCWGISNLLNPSPPNLTTDGTFWTKPFKPDYLMMTLSYWDEKMQNFDNRHMEIMGQSDKTFSASHNEKEPWTFRLEHEALTALHKEIVRDTGTAIFKPFPGVDPL